MYGNGLVRSLAYARTHASVKVRVGQNIEKGCGAVYGKQFVLSVPHTHTRSLFPHFFSILLSEFIAFCMRRNAV